MGSSSRRRGRHRSGDDRDNQWQNVYDTAGRVIEVRVETLNRYSPVCEVTFARLGRRFWDADDGYWESWTIRLLERARFDGTTEPHRVTF
jgi:hypothetical protein